MPAETKKKNAEKKATEASVPASANGYRSAVENTVPAIKFSILNHLKHTLARDTTTATKRDWWISTPYASPDHIFDRLIATQPVHLGENVPRPYYFSLEYLI